MTYLTVLYVEDEENDALFMQRAFKKEGLEALLKVVEDVHHQSAFTRAMATRRARAGWLGPW